MTSDPGDWSRPDAGVDPDDYVEEDQREVPHTGGPADDRSDTEGAPGASLVGDGPGDDIEPNEPA